VDTTEDPGQDLTELADKLLAVNSDRDGASRSGEPIGIFYDSGKRKYTVQVSTYICPNYYETKEEAAQRWLELMIQGKLVVDKILQT